MMTLILILNVCYQVECLQYTVKLKGEFEPIQWKSVTREPGCIDSNYAYIVIGSVVLKFSQTGGQLTARLAGKGNGPGEFPYGIWGVTTFKNRLFAWDHNGVVCEYSNKGYVGSFRPKLDGNLLNDIAFVGRHAIVRVGTEKQMIYVVDSDQILNMKKELTGYPIAECSDANIFVRKVFPRSVPNGFELLQPLDTNVTLYTMIDGVFKQFGKRKLSNSFIGHGNLLNYKELEKLVTNPRKLKLYYNTYSRISDFQKGSNGDMLVYVPILDKLPHSVKTASENGILEITNKKTKVIKRLYFNPDIRYVGSTYGKACFIEDRGDYVPDYVLHVIQF